MAAGLVQPIVSGAHRSIIWQLSIPFSLLYTYLEEAELETICEVFFGHVSVGILVSYHRSSQLLPGTLNKHSQTKKDGFLVHLFQEAHLDFSWTEGKRPSTVTDLVLYLHGLPCKHDMLPAVFDQLIDSPGCRDQIKAKRWIILPKDEISHLYRSSNSVVYIPLTL